MQNGISERAHDRLPGVPERRLGNTFVGFDLTRSPEMLAAYEQCERVAQRESWCAFLVGPPGNGKTHLAIAALAAWKGSVSPFWKVPDFLVWLRAKFSDVTCGVALVEQAVDNYGLTAALTVFDDYGAHNPTGWAEEQMYRILDRRYEERLPTVVTSNVAIDALDVRIVSRFREGLVLCKGKDWRAG